MSLIKLWPHHLRKLGVIEPLKARTFMDRRLRAGLLLLAGIAGIAGWEKIRCPAAHNAVGLAGESPAVGIDCLST